MAFFLRRFVFSSRSASRPARFRDDGAAFVATLDRERLRTDRTRSPFCIVLFRPADESDREGEATLIEFLCKRLRVTDEVGRWRGAIAATLVDTPRAGGARLADEALAAVARFGGRWNATVRTYPDDGLEEADGARDDGLNDVSSNGATPTVGVGGRASDAARAPSGATGFFLRELCPPVPLWKRAFDAVAAAVGLAILSPVLLVAALAIKIGSPGPILFAQMRTGRRGVPFKMYKFRTMVVDAESRKAALRSQSVQDGPAFKLDQDPRVTRIGAILRKSCIDELPQLWNVLRGEMSIVGPRPLPVDEAAKCEDWQQRRHSALPGLTCYWQAMGTARLPFREWMRLDLRYVREISPWVDLRLISRTLAKVVLARASR